VHDTTHTDDGLTARRMQIGETSAADRRWMTARSSLAWNATNLLGRGEIGGIFVQQSTGQRWVSGHR